MQVILMLLGLLRLGSVSRYISPAVMLGFTNAGAHSVVYLEEMV
jgi:MFS superfamily sulfate permease-like transporter